MTVNFFGVPHADGGPGWICVIHGDVTPDADELANVGPYPTIVKAFRAAERAMKWGKSK